MILCALNVVSNHYSLRSAGGNEDLFPEMFPDSEMAKHFALLAEKVNYIIHCGLEPYFRIRIMKKPTLKGPKLSPKFTSCFDESFNEVSPRNRWTFTFFITNMKQKLNMFIWDPGSWLMVLLITWTISRKFVKN